MVDILNVASVPLTPEDKFVERSCLIRGHNLKGCQVLH